MKYIVRQAGITALCFVCLYSLLLGLALILSPTSVHKGSLDLNTAADTIYLTSPKYAMLGRYVLDVPDQKVLLVGASNTGVGFKQGNIQSAFPCAKISNLSIGFSNISEVRQMIDLVHEVQDKFAQRTNTFVIGIWYGMFVDTELHWPNADRNRGDTDLDIERYRYGFYRRTPKGPVAVLPINWLPAEAVLIRPYLLVEKIARELTLRLRYAVFIRPPILTDADRETRVVSDKDKSDAFAYWKEAMGGKNAISGTQAALLQDVIERLLDAGEKVVVADLPIPAWHREGSPYQATYERLTQDEIFDHFRGRSGFAALKMDDLGLDENYSDAVHPRPHVASIWTARLISVIQSLMSPCEPAVGQNSSAQHRS
jgi:hypothetical protein